MKIAHLNCQPKTKEKKIIVLISLIGNYLILLIKIEEEKETIAEEHTEDRGNYVVDSNSGHNSLYLYFLFKMISYLHITQK